MSWSCLHTEERLTDYLDGQLEAAERARLEAHLAECAACRQLAAQVRALAMRLPRLEPEVEPTWLVYRILEATSGAMEAKKERTWKKLLAGLLTPRFALGLGSVAATLFILFQALGINPRKVSAADLNPVSLYRAANRQMHLTYANGVRFVNDLRVVYEIRSRLQEASVTPSAPQEQEQQKNAPSPQSEHKLKNDLLHRGPSLTRTAAVAGSWLGGFR